MSDLTPMCVALAGMVVITVAWDVLGNATLV